MDQFISPKKIYHGEGSLAKLEGILQEIKAERIFILTDPVLKNLGVIDPILKIMDIYDVKVDVVTNVVPEPPVKVGNQVVEEAREKQPDLVIGIGGGSALDLAKIAAVLTGNDGRVEDYLNLSGTKKLANKGLPKVLIPTTSGTGAEVTDIAVFSLENSKDVITHEYLLADYAIIDPALTYTLPPRITAASGVDALTHAIEAYTSVNSTPLTDSLALDAITRITGNIRTAVWNGNDEHARDQMALGSLIAGLSFYNAGVAGVHALAYPLGGLFKISHGESNAVLLPYVYDHIWMACMDKMKNIAVALSLPTDGKTDREVAQQVVRSLLDLIKDIGLPTTIRDYNIKSHNIDVLTENGVQQTRLLARSPKVLDEKSIKQIYTNVYEGVLQNS